MKRILAMIIAMVMMVNSSLGYTLTLRYGDYVLTREGIMAGTNMRFGLTERVIGWTVTDDVVTPSSIDNKTATFIMPEADVEIDIEDGYLVTASSGLSPSGISDVKPGESITYTFSGDSNTQHTVIKVDGVTKKTVNGSGSYTFTPVGDCTIELSRVNHTGGADIESTTSVTCSQTNGSLKKYRKCTACSAKICWRCSEEI